MDVKEYREGVSVSRSEVAIFHAGDVPTLICNQLPLVSSHSYYYINDLHTTDPHNSHSKYKKWKCFT